MNPSQEKLLFYFIFGAGRAANVTINGCPNRLKLFVCIRVDSSLSSTVRVYRPAALIAADRGFPALDGLRQIHCRAVPEGQKRIRTGNGQQALRFIDDTFGTLFK